MTKDMEKMTKEEMLDELEDIRNFFELMYNTAKEDDKAVPQDMRFLSDLLLCANDALEYIRGTREKYVYIEDDIPAEQKRLYEACKSLSKPSLQ